MLPSLFRPKQCWEHLDSKVCLCIEFLGIHGKMALVKGTPIHWYLSGEHLIFTETRDISADGEGLGWAFVWVYEYLSVEQK